MYIIILSFLTAFTLTYFAIPPIIHISKVKYLFDEPNSRSSHSVRTPSLGGIAIFSGAIFSLVLWTPFSAFANLQYILCALIVLFLVGAKDDILPMSPSKKLIAQVIAAAILIFKSNIRLDGFYGIFGWHEEAGWVFSIVLSFFVLLLIINAFNLIDGINGLAGSLGALVIFVLGIWFFLNDRLEFATLAFATMGAIVAFLKYNFTPARIFMGDTGSLIIGLVTAVLMIKFVEVNYLLEDGSPYKFQNTPAVAAGILLLPLFDTLRVFITRIMRGHSPFHPDRRHIHHLLIDFGLSHMQATFLLVMLSVCFITLVFSLHREMELHLLIFILLGGASGLTYYLHKKVLVKKPKKVTI